jgi:hypothetical protein
VTQDANDLLMSGGIKSISWKDNPVGYTVVGTIVDQPKVSQMTKYDSDELDYWPSGDPKMQIIVTLQTDQRDPADALDDGKRRLHIPPRMMKPVREAVQRAAAPGLATGGRLAVRRTGGTGATGSPFEFAADYAPPAVDPGSMLGANGSAQAAAAPPLTAAAQTAPVAAAPPPAQQQLPAAPPPAPPGVDPAVWAALPDTQRQAVLAAMAPAAAAPQQQFPF